MTTGNANTNRQAMKRRLYISLWTLGLCLLAAIQTIGQVSICGDRQSSHPVEIRALHLRDSLLQADIDTIIVYRHWLGINGFNGYGKVIWLDKGQCFQHKIEFENSAGNYGIKQVNLSRLKSDSLFTFFFDNHIDTIITNPTEQSIYMSHDAQHFLELSYNAKSYCFLISGLLVQFNPDNLRAKFISLLSDENDSIVELDGERIRSSPKSKKKKS
jgi:hypothetical protein